MGRIPTFATLWLEYQCPWKNGQTSNVWNDTIRKPMCTKKGLEFQSLEGKGQNSKVHKNRARIPMSKRIKS